jgi:hypothetical protein
MKHLRILFSVALLAAIVISGGGRGTSAAATCSTTLAAGSDIQTAIDTAAPGDVICLQPGIYSPLAKIKIDESITLQGPQAGVDPRPSAGTTRTPGDTSTEAIIDGSDGELSGIIVIQADDVILDGLEVRNGTGDLIDSESSIPTADTVLRYNIIRNASGDEGIQLRNVQNGVIEYNYAFDIAQDGINMCCDSTGGYIQYNEVHNNSSENAAIYVYGSEQMTIQCNLVYDVFGNDGIKLGSKGGADASLSGGSILYNTVHNTVQDGISVYTSDTAVQGNEVHHSTSENGAIYVAWGVSNVTISYNDVHDNALDTGKWGDPGGIMIGTAVAASTVHVNYNNIYGNSPNGVTNKATALLDATNNWWGDASGPYHPTANPGGTGNAVSDNVDFDPWLAEPQVIVSPCIPEIEVTIDIKPGSFPNSINHKSKGKIPVAILSTADFDAPGDVDWDSLTFGPTGDEVSLAFCSPSPEDVDDDGLYDLVCHFFTQSAGFACGDEMGYLKGQTLDDVPMEGSDSVRIVPCK